MVTPIVVLLFILIALWLRTESDKLLAAKSKEDSYIHNLGPTLVGKDCAPRNVNKKPMARRCKTFC